MNQWYCSSEPVAASGQVPEHNVGIPAVRFVSPIDNSLTSHPQEIIGIL